MRLNRWAALVVATGVAAAVFGYLLLTPARGEVLLLLTARQADRIAATSVDLHSAQGWTGLGSIQTRAVPKAPETAEAFTARVPIGSYDRVRMAGVSVPVAFTVRKDLLNTLLVGISGGRPMPDGAYGGRRGRFLELRHWRSSVVGGVLGSIPRQP